VTRPRAGRDPLAQPFVEGAFETPGGPILRVLSTLSAADRRGGAKVRWGIGRMDYLVEPGLYAVGSPGVDSPVLVSANYKLSFDALRASLAGRSAFLLVVDTHGINVWCAAGKGTFSATEVTRRIAETHLVEIVAQRRVILPQLSAPGVTAREVEAATGFKAVFGPVRSEDLPAYLDAGCRATPAMRSKSFELAERAVLVPMELVPALKWVAALAAALVLLSGLGGAGGYLSEMASHGPIAALAAVVILLAGAVATPILLPWLPGRAFSLKGAIAGLLAFAPSAIAAWLLLDGGAGVPLALELSGLGLIAMAGAAFLALNFTGATTYTSLSGVKREMRFAVPIEIAGAVAGLGLWLAGRLLS
jgi:acetyl-CoA decarbonylase/synthase complex subunit gamma